MSDPELQDYDLAVVGGGLSATATLVSLLNANNKAANHDARSVKRVIVFDKGGAFGGGNTYSSAVANATYLQNPVDMMPDGFAKWITEKDPDWLADWATHVSKVTSQWWLEQRHCILKQQVDSLFVPRGLFGLYQRERYQASLRAARERVIVQHTTATITKLKRTEDEDFVLESAEGIRVRARIVLLAVGMIPTAVPDDSTFYLDKSPEQFVSDLAAKAGAYDGKLVVLGANAAALDVIHLVNSYESAHDDIKKILVVSKTGIMPIPARPITGIEPSSYLIENPTAPNNASELVSTVRRDVTRWQNAGLAPFGLTQKGISRAILDSLKALPAEERARILEFHGRELSLVSRRTVPVYSTHLEKLKNAGRMQILAGDIATVNYFDSKFSIRFNGNQPEMQVAALVDCRGAGRLDETSDPLLRELIANGHQLAQANSAGSGFIVNDNFEASPNVFIMGDLITGYDGSHGMVWHLQNAPRIEKYGAALGKTLVERLSKMSQSS